INYALWAACYPSGEVVELEWVVIAKAIEKESIGRLPISITPYANDYQPASLYISGTATENGAETDQAIAMRERVNADGSKTGTFEIYTSLIGGESLHFRDRASMQSRKFGGANGALVACGEEITAPESGVYRVLVDLNEDRYEFAKIDRWSL